MTALANAFAPLWKWAYRKGEVLELRIPDAGRERAVSGYFDDPNALTNAVQKYDGQANVYLVLNPVNPALLARSANVVTPYAKTTTTDSSQDTPSLRLLLIDLDSQRPAGISATDAEHANALCLAAEIRAFLSERFGAQTAYADSGNGAHLLLPIDLPNTQENVTLLKRVLEGLAFHFDTEEVHVDLKTFNPSRLCKLYGTLAVKGSHTADRPHRRAHLLDVPAVWEPVSLATLERLASLRPEPEPQEAPLNRRPQSGEPFDLQAFIERHGLRVWREKQIKEGTRYTLEECPFGVGHERDSAVLLYSDGRLGFGCLHHSCAGKGWRDLRERLEPGCYDRPALSERNSLRLVSSPSDALPAPVWKEKPPRPQMPEQAYSGLLGEYVRRIQEESEADPAGILLQSLVGFGSLVGRNAYVPVGAQRHYANLFCVTVGGTSTGAKGQAWSVARWLLERLDRQWAHQRIQGGLSSGEGLIYAVRDPLEETKVSKSGDPKQVITDAGVEDKRLLCVEPEFARTLTVMARESNILSAVLRDAWDSGLLRVMTKQSRQATDAHISVIGHITPEELSRRLSETETFNGFVNRFLWCVVERSQLLPFGGYFAEERFADLFARLQEAAERANIGRAIQWNEAARPMWETVYPALTRDRGGLFGAATQRAASQTLRLALVYALTDDSSVLTPEHLTAALAVWQFCEASAQYLFGEASGDPIADRILQALREAPEGMTRTEINRLFGSHTSSPRILAALSELATAEKVVKESVTDTGGRPSERWRALA